MIAHDNLCHLTPSYARDTRTKPGPTAMDYGVQLGRRFRALKLWMVMRAFGTEGLASRIREHVRIAQEFASWVDADSDWEIMAPYPFSLVCFRYAPDGMNEEERNALNEKILEAVNTSGEAFFSHTKQPEARVLESRSSVLKNAA